MLELSVKLIDITIPWTWTSRRYSLLLLCACSLDVLCSMFVLPPPPHHGPHAVAAFRLKQMVLCRAAAADFHIEMRPFITRAVLVAHTITLRGGSCS